MTSLPRFGRLAGKRTARLPVLSALLFALPVLAPAPGDETIDWFKLIMGLLGGLAMFLFGMEQGSQGLQGAASDTTRLRLRLQSERIGVQETRHGYLVRMELELLDNLRRIYTLAKRVAKDFVPEEVASKA